MARLFRLTSIVVQGVLGGSVLAAGPIIGVASVIDGDTIEIHGERIRSIPSTHRKAGSCAAMLMEHLAMWSEVCVGALRLHGRSTIRCEARGRDRYQRIIAVCFKSEVHLNAWMVEQGWARCISEVWNRLHWTRGRGSPCPPRRVGRLLRDAMDWAGPEQMSRNAAAQAQQAPQDVLAGIVERVDLPQRREWLLRVARQSPRGARPRDGGWPCRGNLCW